MIAEILIHQYTEIKRIYSVHL